MPRKNCRTGVALLFGTIPEGRVFARPKLFHLIGMTFRFLQTQNIWFFRRQIFEKILFKNGPQPIHIPGYQFHAESLRQASRRLKFS
jgi:hypothetical protein